MISNRLFRSTASLTGTLILVGMTSTSAQADPGLGKLQFQSDKSDANLRFIMMSQLRFDYHDREAADGSRVTSDKFVLQRVRPIVMARFLEDKLLFRLHLNAGPTQIELLDLFGDYAFHSQVKLRIGQQKIPLTRHRYNSFARLTLVDWSDVARFFGSERQIGAQVHNDFKSETGIEYSLGVFTGVNARNGFERGPWQVYGIPQANPSDLADPDAPARLHPEIAGRIGWHLGEDKFNSDSDDQGGGLRLTTGLSASWDFDPQAGQDFAGRLAPEILVKAYGASASFVGHLGLIETGVGESIELGAYGFLSEVAYRYRFIEAAFRYSHVEVSEQMRDDARAVAEALTDADPARPNAGSLERRQEISAGLNVYIFNHGLKVQADYVALLSELASGSRTDHAVRTLLQLAF